MTLNKQLNYYKKGITQAKLAEISGIGISTIQRYWKDLNNENSKTLIYE
jgi:transcriptional regulator with XRE-family HTH domain